MTEGEKIIRGVGFDFDWDSKKVWKLDVPITKMRLIDLIWHFEYPFWEKEGSDDYNLTPWEVIKNPKEHSNHFSLVESYDTSYPIDVMENKGRHVILDGLHRLVKLYLQKKEIVEVLIIPKDYVSVILRDK
jgi:hypothetical protein